MWKGWMSSLVERERELREQTYPRQKDGRKRERERDRERESFGQECVRVRGRRDLPSSCKQTRVRAS